MINLVRYYLIRIFSRLFNPPAIKDCTMDRTAKILPGCQIVNSTIDKYTYIGDYSCLINCEIGRFTSIAQNCIVGGAMHPTSWVSTSPVFHNGKNILRKNFSDNYFEIYHETVIGNDVWIGSNSLIKSGVKIGNGVIVGMGSIVTHDIPDYEIWAGNPAKLIRKRFKDEDIEKLLKVKWWEWSDDIILNSAKDFNDINAFLSDNKGIF